MTSLPSRLTLILVLLLGTWSQARTHTVAKSETCYSISRSYGVSVDALMKANGISDPTKLRLGQKITIPKKGTNSKAPTSSKKISLKSSNPAPKAAVTRSKTIIIDPGHGGRDRGASRSGVHEADLNLKVSLKLRESLKAKGYRVVMTRTSDRYLSLSQRAAIANRYRNALFICVHFNATNRYTTNIRGTETYYASKSGRALAQAVQKRITTLCSTRNRGARLARYSVLMNTNCPAVLIECGYLSNTAERRRASSSSHQQNLAAAIMRGILDYDAKF
ncbi:MAG: N-acetylmuramoyl-L-alanine amidase [Verrucomicrobiales bacterium]